MRRFIRLNSDRGSLKLRQLQRPRASRIKNRLKACRKIADAHVKSGGRIYLDEAMIETPTIDEPSAQTGMYNDLMDAARLAYIYGFPSCEMVRLRFQAFNRARQGQPVRLNTLRHVRVLTIPTTSRVTNTNADTLKSSAWLDLSRHPLVIHVPDTADRYYSLALMDFFTNNFAVLGRRSTSTVAGNFCLAGPQWDGAVPAGMTVLRSPTNAVWALVRILVRGPDDLAVVRRLQDQFTISVPTGSGFAAAPHNPDPPSLAPLDGTKPLTFFDVLNGVLTENPPPPRDKAVLDRLRVIGVGPSLKFNRRDFTQPQLDALRRGLASARETVRARGPRQAEPGHWPSDALLGQLRGPVDASPARIPARRPAGWSRPAATVGNFGTDYLLRARCALRGIGGLPSEDAMYFITTSDAAGARLGGGRYVLRFPPEGTPPVDAYWSLTAYWTDENNRRWLVPNSINRYSVGNHLPGLRHGADGSLEIFIQHDRPAGNEENWLPAPDGRFLLTLRAYQPRRELLDGRYTIPEVRPL